MGSESIENTNLRKTGENNGQVKPFKPLHIEKKCFRLNLMEQY